MVVIDAHLALGAATVDLPRPGRSLGPTKGAKLATKTARSQRTVPLPPVMVSALKRHRTKQSAERLARGPKWQEHGYVFTTPIGTPIDPRNCTRLVQAACKAAGVRVVRLHDFRHGCVSVLLAMGVPPRTTMEIVGHTTLEITMNVYGHVTLDDKRAAMDQLGDLFAEPDEGAK